jgi:(E)-4-hydroxy-3-methylbut-2-enyl-diphosphate synthase
MSMNYPSIERRITRQVTVGGVGIGSASPVSVQSMTNTTTSDVAATLAQIEQLASAGADIVRVAAASQADTAALREIVAGASVPIVADVHFHFARAIEAIEAGVAKIRLNPGNIRDRAQVDQVIAAAADAGCAIRVGVNEGSIIDRSDATTKANELSQPLVELMVDKMGEYLQAFEEAGFDQLVLSAKSADPYMTVAASRALASRWDYPLHLGVTHAGTARSGGIRSAAALGALLSEGIGDTIRISLAGDPVAEVRAANELLASLRLRDSRGARVIACPTCGRTTLGVAELAEALEDSLADIAVPVTVAVMGCVVNGPGEAEGAEVAICGGGEGRSALFVNGERAGTVDDAEALEAVERAVRELVSGK